MQDSDTQLPPELQQKLDEVEQAAEKAEKSTTRFDFAKARLVAVLCFGLAFTLGVALRQGIWNSLFFGFFLGAAGFVTAGFQKARK